MKSGGGQVVSPGKDDFTVNPMDVGPAAELAEHIEMVTDIFSSFYLKMEAYLGSGKLAGYDRWLGVRGIPLNSSR